MEDQDHVYTNTTDDNGNLFEFTYKMSKTEIEDFVKLRVSNNYLFSGKRNTSMWAWRAILKHMGLQQKMTYYQAKKKWENMKKRYKDLKYPPEGVKAFPETWPYFSLMDDAMAGRLEGSAPVLKAFPSDRDCGDFLPISKPKKRKASTMLLSSVSVGDGPEIEISLSEDEGEKEAMLLEREPEIDHIVEEVAEEKNSMDSELQMTLRERLVLQRERAVLDREVAILERDRGLLERERAMMEREKAVMERERVMLTKDREAVCRERLALERQRAKLEGLSALNEKNEEVNENSSGVTEDSGSVDRRERFLSLFEKLLEKF